MPLSITRLTWRNWFAGLEITTGHRHSWLLLLPLVAAACLLFFTHLGSPLLEPQEALYAEIPRQMLAEGHLLQPVRHGEPYLQKPPLLYWLVMLSYALLGVSEHAARLVPALAAVALIAVTYGWGRAVRGPLFGFIAALLLCLSGRFVYLGRMLVLDGLLALWVTSALAGAHVGLRTGRLRWWLLAGAACGLGILTKGPLALVLVLGPVSLFHLLDGRGAGLSSARLLAFLGATLAVAAPWFTWAAFCDPEAMRGFFLLHNVERFVQPFDHAKPLWFFVPDLLLFTLPWSLLLFPLIRLLATRRPEQAVHRSSALGFFLLAFVWSFGLFSLSGCKRPAYLLPCLPLFALLLASGFTAIQPVTRAGWLRWGAIACMVLAIFVAGIELWLPAYHRQFGLRGQVRRHRALQHLPVACYPHRWDSVSFCLERDDVQVFGPGDRSAFAASIEKQGKTLVFVKNASLAGEFLGVVPPGMEFVPVGRVGANVTAGIVRRRGP